MTQEIMDTLREATAAAAPVEEAAKPAPAESAAGDERDLIAEHVESLRQQAEELGREVRGFDLGELIKDEQFLRMTAPGSGISLRRAYYALAADKAAAEAAKRPREGGGRTAAAIASVSPARMDKAQRAELKLRIMSAAARGEKIYP